MLYMLLQILISNPILSFSQWNTYSLYRDITYFREFSLS